MKTKIKKHVDEETTDTDTDSENNIDCKIYKFKRSMTSGGIIIAILLLILICIVIYCCFIKSS